MSKYAQNVICCTYPEGFFKDSAKITHAKRTKRCRNGPAGAPQGVSPEGRYCLSCLNVMQWSRRTKMLSRWPVGRTLLLWFTRSVYQTSKTSLLRCLCGAACLAHRVNVSQFTDSSCREKRKRENLCLHLH